MPPRGAYLSPLGRQGEFRMKKKQKKNSLLIAVIVLFLLAGLSLLLYPTVSNFWNTFRQAQSILSYSNEVSALEEAEHQRLWEEAEQFNRSLLDRPNPYGLTEAQESVYHETLLAAGSDVMAYLEIPTLDIKLPILHGIETETLERAVGHLPWSSLPIGGESTHCVLSGHRGLPSSELLTNIDQLSYDDTFYIHVLGRKLTYRVDSITVVEPSDVSQLGITPGKDYVTLLTCTPYGINSHRLLVRGVRVDTDAAAAGDALNLANETKPIDLDWLMPVLLGTLAVVLLLLLLSGRKEKKKKGTPSYDPSESTSFSSPRSGPAASDGAAQRRSAGRGSRGRFDRPSDEQGQHSGKRH